MVAITLWQKAGVEQETETTTRATRPANGRCIRSLDIEPVSDPGKKIQCRTTLIPTSTTRLPDFTAFLPKRGYWFLPRASVPQAGSGFASRGSLRLPIDRSANQIRNYTVASIRRLR